MAEPKKRFVTIVPPSTEENGLTPAQGTKVMLDDGSELANVYKVELHAEAMSLWQAVIYLRPVPHSAYNCLAKMVSATPVPWWKKILLRAAGVELIDDGYQTNLGGYEAEYTWSSGLVTQKDKPENE